MAQTIPFDKLRIDPKVRTHVSPDAPKAARLAVARGMIPADAASQLNMLYVVATHRDPELTAAAKATLRDLPPDHLMTALDLSTHPKVVEWVAEFRVDLPRLDHRIVMLRTSNSRTVRLVARRAGPDLCERLCINQERLLLSPKVFLDLHANPNCPENDLFRAESFLRMQKCLPEGIPERRPFEAAPEETAPEEPAPTPDASTQPEPTIDAAAEVAAAISGTMSPALLAAQTRTENLEAFAVGEDKGDLGGFKFDFHDEGDMFSWDLTRDPGEGADDYEHEGIAQHVGMDRIIADMSVGKKIQLAYRGNKEARGILVRDSNKLVATAVIRSGRVSDREAMGYAGNKNLDSEVVREISANPEWVRKYPVKVALVQNPKTPVGVAIGFVKSLQKKDLQALSRNRNVSSALTQAANRLYRQKYMK